MDAIKLLKQQHREVDSLFSQFEKATDKTKKRALLDRIADALAIHAAIEERHLYPDVRSRATEEELAEAYDEHLSIKQLILDALAAKKAPGFDGHVAALKGAVEHHVEEEENELFPKIAKLIDQAALEAIGVLMEAEVHALTGTAPRKKIVVRSEAPAFGSQR